MFGVLWSWETIRTVRYALGALRLSSILHGVHVIKRRIR